jgi:epoxyqueuosine reductase QueG
LKGSKEGEMKDLTGAVREKAFELGARVVGIADATHYEGAPEGHKPGDILEGANCVVSMGFPHPRTVIEKAMPTQYTRNIFTTSATADEAANALTLWLEEHGWEAIPIATRSGLFMDALTGELRGDLSHKHTAMLAGLGQIGRNSLLLHPEFGARLCLTSVVTNAPLTPDRPFSETLCPGESCLKCVRACPVRAISPGGKVDKGRCAKHCRAHAEIYKETFGLYFCWECRRVCPVGRG